MPKPLNRYITSDYLGAAQRMRGSSRKRRIVAYVESYDDIFFWRTLLSDLETDDLYFEVMLPSRKSLQKGKKSALIAAVSRGLGPNMIACVDADYDYLLHGATSSSEFVCSNPYVFHTYVYAIENFQCYAPSLHGVCVMATLNDDHSLFDFEAYLAEYSRIVFPLFVWSVWAYSCGQFREFSMMEFATIVAPGNVNLFKPEDALRSLHHKVDVALSRLRKRYPDADESYNAVMQTITQLGVTPDTTYLYMRGHDLVDKVVLPVLENTCNVLRRRREKEIKNLAVHTTQRQNELAGYLHSAAAPAEMLRKHTDYHRSPLYQQIQQDIRAQVGKIEELKN